ncbi:MAG: hypothetical protein BAJALOKI1v1_30042 [Promethearchaeota archaeon]|nr:MAG: hypothetical protein BAJALOKI1v1_30042 [Candidatus Lokiarchaeota archaeon]
MSNNINIPDMDDLRRVFMKYSQQTFNKIPQLPTKPRILDVGCGSGESTILLAQLTDGDVTGIDIDMNALNKFQEKLDDSTLKDRIEILKESFIENDFSNESFDLVWAEGVFHIIGYDKCLQESSRVLKNGGFLVALDTIKVINKHLKSLDKFGFKVIDKIIWQEGAWWTEYYEPLERKIKYLRDKGTDPSLFKHLLDHEHEIAMVKHNPNEFDCAHYIYQKVIKQKMKVMKSG